MTKKHLAFILASMLVFGTATAQKKQQDNGGITTEMMKHHGEQQPRQAGHEL